MKQAALDDSTPEWNRLWKLQYAQQAENADDNDDRNQCWYCCALLCMTMWSGVDVVLAASCCDWRWFNFFRCAVLAGILLVCLTVTSKCPSEKSTASRWSQRRTVLTNCRFKSTFSEWRGLRVVINVDEWCRDAMFSRWWRWLKSIL